MNRREFVVVGGTAGLAAAAGAALPRHRPESAPPPTGGTKPPPAGVAAIPPKHRELAAPVVVIGGGLGGCAGALAALRAGVKVILTEETDWVGGQLTQQAVPPDENQWIETFGASKSFRDLRESIRAYYREHYPLKPTHRKNPILNPGSGWVSRLCHEPKVALAIIEGLLKPYRDDGRLQVLLNAKAVSADVVGDRVKAVTVRDEKGDRIALVGQYFLDATEQGDLLPLTNTEHVTGAESRKQTGEPSAAAEALPGTIQSFTVCFALDHDDGADHRIEKPAAYEFWKKLDPPILTWGGTGPADQPYSMSLDPAHQYKAKLKNGREVPNFWTYRRILDRRLFENGKYPSDISLINWSQNDYWLGPLHGPVTEAEAAEHLARAKQLSFSLIYWLQNEALRPDGKVGWPGLRLRKDVVGTEDGMAKYPYIRESRRIKAEFTVIEQHVSAAIRKKIAKAKEDARAEVFADSVGIGQYPMDLHRATGRPGGGGGGATFPFQIPLGALLPVRVENLLAACKNLGVTHLTNGCYRLHPIEWNVGESAGALAAFCLSRKEPPRQVRKDPKLLAAYQAVLRGDGVVLEWPAEAAVISR